MDFIFLNPAGQTLFSRNDIESGHWVQEQMNLTADFPYDPAKKIERGMRVAFRDPATDNLEVFEIRVVMEQEPDHFQQITAEHIALSELSDEHINTTEITDKTASQALTTALTGTLWSVGTSTATGSQSADISRGSVWDAVNTIQSNWNVYITPRVVISSAGAITGRYLDISPAHGTWRGLRLSVRKNMTDPAVTINDEEVLTALYGYGGNIDVPQATGDDKTEELTFADVVWTASSDHPAKPSGQTYLEWPEKTALYGRNGRPRFGYYQNGNIKDANVLIQKTWEALKKTADPKISITGTVTDLYRLGYKDQPIRLHDLAIVEIEETGEVFNKEIICCDVDLVDPTGTRPEIGDYIPNIVYINRETNNKATGGRGGGGGGGGRGLTNLEEELSDTITEFIKNNQQIGMVVKRRDGNDYIVAGQIILAINKTGESGSYESAAYINANHINISATDTAHLLAGSIVYDANGKLVLKDSSGAGIYIERQGGSASFGIWDKGNLTGGVMVDEINGQSTTFITGNKINISSTSTAHLLSGSIYYNEWGNLILEESSGGGIYIKHNQTGDTATFGVWDRGNLTGGVMVQQINGQTGTKLTLQADVIDINGLVTALAAKTIGCAALNVTQGIDCGHLYSDTYVYAEGNITCNGTLICDSFNAGGTTHSASWKSQTVVTSVSISNNHTFLYGNSSLEPTGRASGSVVLSTPETANLHYLGY